jgi:hypothetical protein
MNNLMLRYIITHCWIPETAAKKREAKKAIESLNKILEPELRQE